MTDFHNFQGRLKPLTVRNINFFVAIHLVSPECNDVGDNFWLYSPVTSDKDNMKIIENTAWSNRRRIKKHWTALEFAVLSMLNKHFCHKGLKIVK